MSEDLRSYIKNMKKIFKIIFFFLITFLIVIIYFYLKPAIEVEQLKVENDIPIKIGPYSSLNGNDSVLVYVPYKFSVSNNRLKKIEIGKVMFNNSFSGSYDKHLLFDNKGLVLGREFNRLKLDNLLHKKQIIGYLQLYYNKEIFSFSDKEYYFYKPFKFKKSSIDGLNNHNKFRELVHNFLYYQKQKLHNKSKFNPSKKVIDSLYKLSENTKIILSYNSLRANDYANGYEIEYYLDSNKQTLIDRSKMTNEQLMVYLSGNPFEK